MGTLNLQGTTFDKKVGIYFLMFCIIFVSLDIFSL